MERVIPRTMASQHPDHVRGPPWLDTPLIGGDDEVEEVFQSWSRLGCMEAMWDAEGKDVDLNVVRKLYTSHPDFFRQYFIGRDYFLTYRIPNPSLDIADRKVYFETLQSIPKHYDAAKLFYGDEPTPPVFEVILPFVSRAAELVRLVNTYQKAVVALGEIPIDYPDMRLREVIGDIRPERIEVIPLLEDYESISSLDKIVTRFVELHSPRYLRVFIARSDPALNNGMLTATLLAMLALQKMSKAVYETGIPIYPIIGAGTMPFRGGLAPDRMDTFLKQYGAFTTVTVQSAFRYDYSESQVVEAIKRLNSCLPEKPLPKHDSINEGLLSKLVEKLKTIYLEFASEAASTITVLSRLVPPRRARKLHIGVFSYSRRIGTVELPRAIPYACVFYTLGLPPEFIGLRALNMLKDEEMDLLNEVYPTLRDDLKRAASLTCIENINMILGGEVEAEALKPLGRVLPLYMEDIQAVEEQLSIRVGPRKISERKYSNILNNFLISYDMGDLESARDELLAAAAIRRCLG